MEVVIIRGEKFFKRDDVDHGVFVISMRTGVYFQRKAKKMTNDLDNASEIVAKATKVFSENLEGFMKKQDDFVASSKKASGNVRDAMQKMSDGLLKIEKTANFDRLERVIGLLERANLALSSLAELENSGKLDRIVSALK